MSQDDSEEGAAGSDRRALVEELAGRDGVEAAAVVDEKGGVDCSAGSARVLRRGDAARPLDEASDSNHEDVYITSLGDARYLVVVFPAGGDFDDIESTVDRALEENR